MIFLASWGKKGKQIGYFGITKCPRCKNYTHFFLYEENNNVKLFLITVAKYNKKRYLVCSICESGFELDNDKYYELIGQMPRRFDKDVTTDIWNTINKNMQQKIVSHNNSDDEPFELYVLSLKSDLVDRYGNEENVVEIFNTFFNSVRDEDKAR